MGQAWMFLFIMVLLIRKDIMYMAPEPLGDFDSPSIPFPFWMLKEFIHRIGSSQSTFP